VIYNSGSRVEGVSATVARQSGEAALVWRCCCGCDGVVDDDPSSQHRQPPAVVSTVKMAASGLTVTYPRIAPGTSC
jgi:hypothetical protein